MKHIILLAACATALTGCAGLTKGVETARGTALGLIDTVRVSVDKAFTVVSNGAGAAEKIAGAATQGAKDTVTPVTTSQ